jgi:hypothetical protein
MNEEMVYSTEQQETEPVYYDVTEKTCQEMDEYYSSIMAKLITGDREGDHMDADKYLLECLTAFGLVKTVEAFRKIPKWYS